MYIKGEGIEENVAKAFKWYEKAASQGDAGLYNLERMYYNGCG